MAGRTLRSVALTVGDRAVHPLTAQQVLRMVELGILGEDEPVELLDGVLTRVSPKSPQHGEVISRLVAWLVPTAHRARFRVLTEHPLVVPQVTALPEPDVVVLPAEHSPTRLPTTALLVVEVAMSSHHADLSTKPPLYAAAEVPDYWVVDVPARTLVRFTEPRDGRYARRDVLTPPATVRPLALDVAPLALADLLSGL